VVALFACWADDYLEAIELEVPVERQVVVDSSPFVMPLAEIADEFETWCVALVDHDSARIFEISGLEIDEVDRAAGNIKNHVKVGGWSQQRYERRREKEIANYCGEIVDRLDELVGDGPCDKLFLAGNDHLVAELNRELPARLEKHLAGTESMAGDLADHEVFEAMKPLIDKAERQSEVSLMEEIKNQRFRDGRAATGPEDTLEALRHGRVYQLLVDREAEQPAIRCRDCEWLTIPNQDDVLPDNCPVCKGDIFEVDLTNEMVELAHKTDAEVETADPMPQLDEWDGIAALLRY